VAPATELLRLVYVRCTINLWWIVMGEAIGMALLLDSLKARMGNG
jgi:hypothetical protein